MTGICSDVCEGEGKETGSDMLRRLCLGDEMMEIMSKGRIMICGCRQLVTTQLIELMKIIIPRE
jgi:hypothetical protein